LFSTGGEKSISQQWRFKETVAEWGVDAAFDWVRDQIADGDATEVWDRRSFGEHLDTPLTAACRHGNHVLIRCLLAGGADPSWPQQHTGATALHYCLSKLEEGLKSGEEELAYLEILRTLVFHGADMSLSGHHGGGFEWTPAEKLAQLRREKPSLAPSLSQIATPCDAVVVLGGPRWQG